MIEKFQKSSQYGEIDLYRISNASGANVLLSSLGAGIVEVNVPDASGKIENVALTYASPADYMADGPCMGKTPGRYANRIARGHFEVGGKEYDLAINNGPNHLHGGPTGFQNRLWDSRIVADDTVEFTRLSPDGEEGYPGNLNVKVTYQWSQDNKLCITYEAETDAPTVVNLTNHTYWNLRGATAGSVLSHLLTLNASHYLPTDENLVPLGELSDVVSTPMDFTHAKPLGRDILKEFSALRYGKGYDACWAIDGYDDGKGLNRAARLESPVSGRVLEVLTTLPGVQVYTGNWLEGCPAGPDGYSYSDYDGVAIECQHFPDSPNQPEFPSPMVTPEQSYRESIVFAFTN